MSSVQSVGPALKVTDVWKHFEGVAALKGVSLEIKPGEVHALLGENGAGKSTLMGVVAGSLQPDKGEIEVLGNVVEDLNPSRSHDLGISIVYQHPALAPDLTVFDNLAMALSSRISRQDAATKKWITEQLAAVGFGASIFERVGDLTVVERQLLEIAKATMVERKIVILDEPTAALGAKETEMLFERIRKLAASGVCIIYITHRVVEVRTICDTVTILRDGEVRGSFNVSEITDSEILRLIVGSAIAREFPEKRVGEPAEPVLTTSGLSGRSFSDVNLVAPAGEIVGIGGIVGNGQTELLRALAGLDRSVGSVSVKGRVQRLHSSAGALEAGIVYLPADRLSEGLLTSMSVRENAAVSTLKMFSKFGIVQRRPEFLAVNRETESLALKARSLEANILSLSGGNQQKVLFSRALINQNMQVLLANEPTQGVDVGARAEIYRTLRRVAAGGVAVIMVSSDVRELSGLCDRVVVMSSGRQVGEFVGEDVTEETITRAILTSTVRREGGELASASGAKRGWLGVVKRLGKGDFGAPIVLVVIMAIVSILTANHDGRFLATYNLNNLALLIAGLGFVAVGEAFVILTGGIDLSVGPLVGLVAVIGSFFETNSRNVGSMVLGFVIMLAACAAVGLVNGLFVQSGLFTPIAATLVTYTGIQGVSLLIRPFQAGYISYSVMSVVNFGRLPYSVRVHHPCRNSVHTGVRSTSSQVG